MHPHFLERKSGAKLLLFFHICKDLAQKKRRSALFLLFVYQYCADEIAELTDTFLAEDGIGLAAELGSMTFHHLLVPRMDGSDLSRYAMPPDIQRPTSHTAPVRQAFAGIVCSHAVHTHTLPSVRIRKPGRQGNAILSFASPDASVLKTGRSIHQFRLL